MQSCSIVLCSVIMVLMTSGNIKGQFDEVYTHLVKFYLHELFEPILSPWIIIDIGRGRGAERALASPQ